MENTIIYSFLIVIGLIILFILLRRYSISRRFHKIQDYKSFNKFLEPYGFAYDPYKDLFYSNLDAWQRDKGYCRLYDEAAAPLSMIMDCEPIYFEYDNKRWLIQFWKGQYGMTTKVEIGVYNTDKPDLNTEYFNGTFYEA